MNKKLNIMDVTLRDGGFRNQFNFSHDVSADVVIGLDSLGLEYIELTTSLVGLGNHDPKEVSFLNNIRPKIKHAKIVAMGVAGITTTEEIHCAKANGVDLIRIVLLNISALPAGIELVKEAGKVGLPISINIAYAMQWQKEDIAKVAIESVNAGADIIYIADSCGSMTPNDVKERVAIVKKAQPKHIGFHGHDNIGMALLNAITAIEEGADFIDGSLRGMGNSSGNLKTEILLTYLNKMHGVNYNLEKLLALADDFERRVPEAEPVHSAQQIMLGVLDLHEKPEYLIAIDQLAKDKNISWFAAAAQFKQAH